MSVLGLIDRPRFEGIQVNAEDPITLNMAGTDFDALTAELMEQPAAEFTVQNNHLVRPPNFPLGW